MPVRPCLDCGKLSSASRCPDHARAREYARTMDKRVRRPQTYAERQRRAEAVRAHVEVYGWVCPGDRDHEAHPCMDLTADHVVPFAMSGDERGPLVVLCRVANGRKADRYVA